MDKEEFEQLKSTVKQWLFHTGSLDPTDYANELKLKFIEPREKRIAELEKEKSELVQNKYNLEYKIENFENKIEHHQEVISALQKENAELKADNDARKFAMAMSEKVEKHLREENADLKERLFKAENAYKRR